MIKTIETRGDFELIELDDNSSDAVINETASIWYEATKSDTVWQTLVKDLSPEESVRLDRLFTVEPYFRRVDSQVFAVREKATSKLVAYAALQHPYTLSEQEKAQAAEHRDATFATLPIGTNLDFMKFFMTNVSGSAAMKHGYDPTKHFHKRGTMTLPQYQRHGFGNWLTSHCNSIADQAGAPTYTNARPAAWKMLERGGFQVRESFVHDFSAFGGSFEESTRLYVRNIGMRRPAV